MKIENKIFDILFELDGIFHKYKGEKGNTKLYVREYFEKSLKSVYKKGLKDGKKINPTKD